MQERPSKLFIQSCLSAEVSRWDKKSYEAASVINRRLTFARRTQLVLVDDPNFVPDFTLPALEFDDNGELLLPGLDFSQWSKMSSQHSPVDNNTGSPGNVPFINLKIRHSSSQGSVNLPSPFDGENEPQDDDSRLHVFGEDEALPWEDWPVTIDEHGNLIEEPELPPHPMQIEDGPFGENDGPAQKIFDGNHLPDDDAQIMFGDDDSQVIVEQGEQQQQHQASVEDIAQKMAHGNKDVSLPSEEQLSSDLGEVPQPQRQRKRRTKALAPDSATHISRSEFKSWSDNYMVSIEEARLQPQQVSTAHARKNAFVLIFGMGLGDIGILSAIPGVEHELAQFYAGDNLKDMLMDEVLAGVEEGVEEEMEERARGAARRRSASVAFGSEDEKSQDDRRVRTRTDEEERQDSMQNRQDALLIEDGMMPFGSDAADMIPEVGREHPGSALSDHHRSSNAPWNRHSSVEVGRNAVGTSPLIGRGSILQQANVKFSDDGAPAFGSDGFAPLQYDGAAHDLSSFADFGAAAGVSTQEANTSQFLREALDREGRNFLGFVEGVAVQRGDEDEHGANFWWVQFDGLFEEQDKTKTVVAQAFLHVLTLATKGQIKVKQEGLDKLKPFGEIRIGALTAAQNERLSAEEELSDGDGGDDNEMEGIEMEGNAE